MKPTLSGTMLVLGASVATVAIATPMRYGTWIDPTAAIAVGGMTINFGAGTMLPLLHVAKLALIGALVPAWRRSRLAGILCAAIYASLVLFSVWNTIAVLALQRSVHVAEASAAIERAASRRAELASIGARLTLVGWKPRATVEAEIAAERHHWMWDATSSCTRVTAGGERQFCARFARLEGARGAAIEAERLRDREAELHREMERQPVTPESRQRIWTCWSIGWASPLVRPRSCTRSFWPRSSTWSRLRCSDLQGSSGRRRKNVQRRGTSGAQQEIVTHDADRLESPEKSNVSKRGRAIHCAVGTDVGRRVHRRVQPPLVQRAGHQ